MSDMMNAWRLLNHHKTNVDDAQKQIDGLKRVEEAVKDSKSRRQQPDVTLTACFGTTNPSLKLSAAETERVLEVIRIMRGQELAQAVEKFETIDLSIVDEYDTSEL